MKRWSIRILIMVAALLALGATITAVGMIDMSFLAKESTMTFEMTDRTVRNPLIGYAPDALHEEEVSNNTLVYVDITFRELWPEKDSFAFESIEEENQLARWRQEGKHVVLRFIADYPQPVEHMDIPDWLFQETGGDGDFYDHAYGKGYSPNYSNPTFIAYHAQAIQALGERYGQDGFVSYVQLGSLGHWGEWHTYFEQGVRQLPLADIRRQYVLPYLEAFPHAKLLMRRPFQIAQEFNLGLYNDMTGHPQYAREWFDWIENGGEYDQTFEEDGLVAMENAWQTAPIGGEFTSAIPMVNMLVVSLEQTLQMIRASHTSFLGPKVPYAEQHHSQRFYEGANQVLNALGYRFGITKAVWSEPYLGNSKRVKLTWENSGNAPMYWNWPVYLYFHDKDNQLLFKLPVDLQLTTLLPGESRQTVTAIPADVDLEGVSFLYVGIEDPMTQQPAVQLISNQLAVGNLFLLREWKTQ